jgi:hypothetical protein
LSAPILARRSRRPKQQFLDLTRRLEESAREREELQGPRRRGPEDDLAKINAHVRVWSVATILLGAGAERLVKEPKRRLAEQIVQFASALIDDRLRAFPPIDFGKLKSKLQSDAELRKICGISEEEPVRAELREFASLIMDVFEYFFLGYIISVVFKQLGNAAGQPVLRPSVASVTSTDPIENLIACVFSGDRREDRQSAAY